MIEINTDRFRLKFDQFILEEHPKDLLVLHFTAGQSAEGAYRWWAGNEERVATAYLLDTDGKVYQCFDPKYWAYHLGIKGSGGRHDKRSVGIEIANVGPLKVANGNLNWWPEDFGRRYCGREDADRWQASQVWRGYTAWATYTPEQLAVLPELVRRVCGDHGIPHKLLAPDDRRHVLPSLASITGIIGHQNARKDKQDPGPAFPWEILTP